VTETTVAVAPLAVSEVFGPTIQGEGPTAGRRAAFVRLARCNLDCAWCDTPYTWDWARFDPAKEIHRATVPDVLSRLDAMAVDRVVVTGGEPLLQQRRLLPLLAACRDRGWAVEVETNGTIVPRPEVAALVTAFNVSPKLANSGIPEARRIRADALAAFVALAATGRAAFKFVATGVSDLDEIAALAEHHGLAPVWVMPEGTDAATVAGRMADMTDAVVARGWNLTPRLHVLLWGDERGR
jgi:7-cyano-7-deazaguanosine (preQ0) biosynthesis protein QueE